MQPDEPPDFIFGPDDNDFFPDPDNLKASAVNAVWYWNPEALKGYIGHGNELQAKGAWRWNFLLISLQWKVLSSHDLWLSLSPANICPHPHTRMWALYAECLYP